MKKLTAFAISIASVLANGLDSTNGYDIKSSKLINPTAYIPSMCYTKTKDKNSTHNPCYACHNVINQGNFNFGDKKLQTEYAFPQMALKNPFKNLFKDYSKEVEKISDEQIIRYANSSNYFDKDGNIILREKLNNLPKEWDLDKDNKWDGYKPDCHFNFDNEGFDRDKSGRYTRWRAFAYLPALGTFFPTNGSMDDVLIRLPKEFAKLSKDGDFNKSVYKINLSILEALIKGRDIAIEPVDERKFNIDLNRNGKLDITKRVVYKWNIKKNETMSYVGYAKELLEQGKIHIAPALYPVGTEFLHSVRYIGIKDNKVVFAKRLKELRYAKKVAWLSYSGLKNIGLSSLKEKDTNPDSIDIFRGDLERGLSNKRGWIYQGFIEDRYGELRPQSKEETLSCIGCHHNLNVTKDTTFAFFRKLDSFKSFRKGWYHWSQKDLKDVTEFKYKDGTYEYSNYLNLNRSGNEFRDNDEVYQKFFNKDGTKKEKMFKKLHKDVTTLLIPSLKRAIKLNKGYKAIVNEQRFIFGKEGHIKAIDNAYKELDDDKKTGNKIYKIEF